ncbi:MAG: hypothetical protein JST00_40160 [Deltaproteobacteria bacterium]|nr:hypothetical protein [Deltaproteobacteria bacterium]
MSVHGVASADPATHARGGSDVAEIERDSLVVPSSLPADPGAALVILQRMVASLRDTGITTGKARVETADANARKAIKDAYEEKHKQFEEEQNRSFWDDFAGVFSEIGKWVGAVASSVAAVMSFGAATPLAVLAVSGAVLSSLSAVDSTFGISEALIGKDGASWLNICMSVGGALMSGGASIGAAMSTASQATASATHGAVQVGTGVANVVAAGADTFAAGGRLAAAGHQYVADMSAAEETAALQRQERFERMAEAVSETIREIMSTRDGQLRQIGALMSEWNETRVAIVRA